MATLRALIRKDKINQEGIAIVQIAVSHKQKTAYIPTDIKVCAKDFVGGMVVRGSNKNNINAQIIEQLNIYNDRLNSIECIDAKNISQLKDSLVERTIKAYHKISDCFDAYFEDKKRTSNTKISYMTAHKIFKKFCKNNDVNIESIDCAYISKYKTWLEQQTPFRTEKGRNVKPSWSKMQKRQDENPMIRHYSPASISTFLAHLKAVINWCIKEGWVSYKIHPFAKTEIRTSPRRENIITAEDYYKIKNYQGINQRYMYARDMFVLSFDLGGANFADMANFDFRCNEIVFERTKVSARTNGTAIVSLPLLQEARDISKQYIDPSTGKLPLGTRSISNMTSELNYCIKQIADEVGVEHYITFTSARKVFAQIGTNLGISDNYLNYLMGHSMSKARGMMNPYSEMDKELSAEILKSIVTMSNFPDKIKEVQKKKLDKILNSILED